MKHGAGGPARARGGRGGEGLGGGGARVGKDRAGGGHGRGELDGCIMHRVHTSIYKHKMSSSKVGNFWEVFFETLNPPIMASLVVFNSGETGVRPGLLI